MSEEFKREDRYIVIKRKDLKKVPVAYRSALVDPMLSLLSHLPAREFVVIESDWPEYQLVWSMIEHRMAGKPVPNFNDWRRADELQQRLTTADERNDDAVDLLRRCRAVVEGSGWVDLERDIAAFLKPSTIEPTFCNCNQGRLPCSCRGAQTEAPATDKIEGMVPTYDGQYAVMIDPKNGHYGWVFYKHADGGWVSSRKATEAEMSSARAQARINTPQ